MADMIDRESLLNKLIFGNSDSIVLREYAIEFVKSAPTIDAVPVVRCQYCQHWNENGWCKLIGQEFDRWPAYYCAEGIRKE